MSAEALGKQLTELRNASGDLRGRNLGDRVAVLGEVADRWLRDDTSLEAAASDIAAHTGYAPAMVRESLRRTFQAWRGEHLRDVVETALAGGGPEPMAARRTVAIPPRLVVAVLAQNTPGLAVAPTFLALGLGAPILLKPSIGEPTFAARLAESIQKADSDLGRAVGVGRWRGGEVEIEGLAFGAADRVIVYGSASTIAATRAAAPGKVVAHGPRVSVAVVGASATASSRSERLTAELLAEEIALLDQRGCLSPQAVLVDEKVDRIALGKALAEALSRREEIWPRRALAEADALAYRRAVDAAEVEAMGGQCEAIFGGGAAPWTVVVDGRPELQPGSLDRFARLHPYADEKSLRAALLPIGESLECVGIAGDPSERGRLATVCVEAGAGRVCRLGEMQRPPASWPADGRPPGLDLLRWVSVPEETKDAQGLRERFIDNVAQTSDAPRAIEVSHARGSWVYDRDGTAWLDLLSGIGVASIGHAHPAVARAVSEQVRRFTHVMVYGEDAIEPQVRLAERIADLVAPRDVRTYFTNSGAEAIEGALKLVRKATGRDRVLAFQGSFHGDTTGALALGGNPFYREPFRPLIGPIEHLTWNDRAELERIDESVAAVFAEPVQAEGGVRIPDPDFLPALAARCREVGSLLVLDEVVTGFGRTGRWFAHQHWPGAEPDVLVMAKSLGGGLPLGAFAAREPLMRVLSEDPPLGHVTTFGGNPVCCAAALASIDVIERDGLVDRARDTGSSLLTALADEVGRGGLVDVRGIGMLIGLEFESPEATQAFADRCRAQHLLVGWTLHRDTVVRIAPPLILSPQDHSTTLTRLRTAMRA